MASAARKMNIMLPASATTDLERIASESGKSLKDVVRNAFVLVKLAHEASSRNEKLVIADADDRPLREVVLY